MTRFPAALLALAVLLPSPPRVSAEAAAVPVKQSGTDVPAPERVKSLDPVYPPDALGRGISAVVVLELVIDEHGKVAEVKVLHGPEPFADAAVQAARKWEYKVTKVDGQPVRVRKIEPIRFAARLPDMKRDSGVPELRQGVAPVIPAASRAKSGRATAHVEVDGDGRVTEAAIRSGESPWTESLLAAIRTWRFAAEEGGAGVGFDVAADFKEGKVSLDLTHPQPAGTAATDRPANAAAPTTAPTTAPATATAAAGSATAAPTTAPVVAPVDGQGAAMTVPVPDAPVATPTPLPTRTEPPIEVVRSQDLVRPSAPDTTAAGGTAAPAPPPVENGLSSIRDVELAPGVPDLVKGRRPVSPPLARLGGLEGDVDVRFSIDSGGVTAVNNVSGRDELKESAESLVRSWVFRRTAPQRLYAIAHLEYRASGVKAKIQPAP
jgi:TonB family protein